MSAVSSESFAGCLIQDEAHDGAFNMAADLFLADMAAATNQICLRLYRWDCPTLSLGFHQRLEASLATTYRQSGVPIVRRPTGGRAVLHDRELTYCLTMPSDHPLLKDGRSALLMAIGRGFVRAAKALGLPAEMVRCNQMKSGAGSAARTHLCFDSLSRWEVHLHGQKWIGSAQRFLPGAFLQHGSILLDLNPAAEIHEGELREAVARALGDELTIRWSVKELDEKYLSKIHSIRAQQESFCAKRAS